MFRSLLLRVERSFLYNAIRLTRIRGASEKVARGFALGLIVNLFPTFGFGVLISGFIARLLGGNLVAGVVGGATLTFVWPLLFYWNIRTGAWFYQPQVLIADLDDVTEKSMSLLLWGKTFMVGAILNSLALGLTVYVLLRLLYHQTRPVALAYFRRHAKDHQRRFRLPRA